MYFIRGFGGIPQIIAKVTNTLVCVTFAYLAYQLLHRLCRLLKTRQLKSQAFNKCTGVIFISSKKKSI